MNIKRTARAITIRLAALAGILIGITLFINLSWFDEDLHPDVAQLRVPREVPMEGNAYAAVMGFWAADDRDARAAGMQLIRAQQEQFRAGLGANPTIEQVKSIMGQAVPMENWAIQYKGCNTRQSLDCADLLIAKLEGANIDNPRIQVLLERFEQILADPRYEEIQEFEVSSRIPDFGTIMTVSSIRLGASFNADTGEFLNKLDQHNRFWKRVLEGGDSLLTKMIALAGLRKDAQFMSAMLRTQRLSEEELHRATTIMAPLTAGERNIEAAFMSEHRIALNSNIRYTDAGQFPRSLLRLAAQENATINEYYMTVTLPMQRRAGLSAAEFHRQRAHEDLPRGMRTMPPPLYNLGGKLILAHSPTPNYADYISRVHDTDGILTLVRLQAEIALNRNSSVNDIVKASTERNPYTREPMEYDPAGTVISFPCLTKGKDACAVRIN